MGVVKLGCFLVKIWGFLLLRLLFTIFGQMWGLFPHLGHMHLLHLGIDSLLLGCMLLIMVLGAFLPIIWVNIQVSIMLIVRGRLGHTVLRRVLGLVDLSDLVSVMSRIFLNPMLIVLMFLQFHGGQNPELVFLMLTHLYTTRHNLLAYLSFLILMRLIFLMPRHMTQMLIVLTRMFHYR